MSLRAIGRLKRGPEKELFDRYADRLEAIGKSHGLHPFSVQEYPESKAPRAPGRMAQEADLLLKNVDEKAFVVVLDERGKAITSPQFTDLIQHQRDDGREETVVIMGGADGLDQTVRERADIILGFGKMTWPHQLVRVLVVEQVYRSLCIMSGHPYHKA